MPNKGLSCVVIFLNPVTRGETTFLSENTKSGDAADQDTFTNGGPEAEISLILSPGHVLILSSIALAEISGG